MKEAPVVAILLAFLLIFGCPGPGPSPPNTTNQTNQTGFLNYTCPDGSIVQDSSQCEIDYCPSSCDDGNICTEDTCGKATGYECKHAPKIPCCGNTVCEPGENVDSCINDCGSCPPSCDDGNPCTRDACSRETLFRCDRAKVTGNAIGCCGYPGSSGYSNINGGFGLDPPKDWELQEGTGTGATGASFIGPAGRPECSGYGYFEAGVYADWAAGFSIGLVKGLPEKSGSWDGLVFPLLNLTGYNLAIYTEVLDSQGMDSEKYIDGVNAELASAMKSGDEIPLVGTTMKGISVASGQEKADQLTAYYFLIAGSSNRSGTWGQEFQNHKYVLYGTTVYHAVMVEFESGENPFSYLNNKNPTSPVLPEGAVFLSSLIDLETQQATPIWFTVFPRQTCNNAQRPAEITVSSSPWKPGYLIGDYVSESLSEIKKSSGYVLLASGDERLDENPARYYAVSFSEDGFLLKRKEVLSLRNNVLYRIEYTAVREDFDKYVQYFDSAVRSFRLIAPQDTCMRQTCLEGQCAIQSIKNCCGNDMCEVVESCSTCPQDCGTCSSTYPKLEADNVFLSTEPQYYSIINCENYVVRVRVTNPLNEQMTVFTDDALQLRSLADTECRIQARSDGDCLATMSGSFGDAYVKDTVEKKLALFAFGGLEKEKGEIIYSKTIRFNVTYDMAWVGPNCMHFYCVPGLSKTFGGNAYVIRGIRDYRGDIQVGNWWCNANRTLESGQQEDVYFNQFYNKTCVLRLTSTGNKQYEKCYNLE